MMRLKIPFLLALFFAGMTTSPVWCQPFQSVLAELDKNYYYPQNQGVKSFSARVQWEQLDVASGSGKFLRNPDFVFFWNVKSEGGLGRFRLREGPGSGDRYQELGQQISPFREAIIPLTLEQKFLDFEGQVRSMGENQLLVKLNPRAGADLGYQLLIDTKDQVIKKLRYEQNNSAKNVEGQFRYLKLDDKLAISESRSRFKLQGQEYFETTRYTYKKVEGIWWVHRIDQTLKREGLVLLTYILKLSDFQITLFSDP